MSDAIVRKQLVGLLHGGNAHLTFDEAVANFPLDKINEPFPNCSYSAWGLLEHIRLTQADILDFMTNREYRNKRWPQDSWPAPVGRPGALPRRRPWAALEALLLAPTSRRWALPA